MRETWRPVVGWEGAYEVSSHGRVRNSRTGYMLKPRLTHKGYHSVRLMHGKKDAERTVHSLVAGAFIGPRPRGYQADHGDGVRTNNRVSNLEYVTPAENVRRARKRVGAWDVRGEAHGRAKLTAAGVREIREACRYESQSTVARRYGITQANVSEVVRRRTWRHVR